MMLTVGWLTVLLGVLVMRVGRWCFSVLLLMVVPMRTRLRLGRLQSGCITRRALPLGGHPLNSEHACAAPKPNSLDAAHCVTDRSCWLGCIGHRIPDRAVTPRTPS